MSHTQPGRKRRASLAVETLEARELMAAGFSLNLEINDRGRMIVVQSHTSHQFTFASVQGQNSSEHVVHDLFRHH
jgi:hypothetical protein